MRNHTDALDNALKLRAIQNGSIQRQNYRNAAEQNGDNTDRQTSEHGRPKACIGKDVLIVFERIARGENSRPADNERINAQNNKRQKHENAGDHNNDCRQPSVLFHQEFPPL